MKKLAGFVLGLVLSQVAQGATYYISGPTGASGNSGTDPSAPKANCAQVSESAGDTVLWKRGETHSGQCALVDGSSASVRTIYGAYGTGDKPVLTHNGNVLLKNDAAYLAISDLVLAPSTQGTSDAGARLDRMHDVSFTDVDFRGGFDGLRSDAVSGPSTIHDVDLTRVTFTNQLQNGVRFVLGSNDALNTYTGYNITWNDVEFSGQGKEPFRLTYQGTGTRYWYSVNMDDIYVHDAMLATPTSPAAVDDDQCMHFRNLRETVKGNSVLQSLRIENCGRKKGSAGTLATDTSLLTGLWVEGMTNVIVKDLWIDGVYTPGLDGGGLFLDSSAADGSGWNSENNDFLGGFITDVRGNNVCTPFTTTQCNNSDAISVTRAASGNKFRSFVLTDSEIGLHVTGNVAANDYAHFTITNNEYGIYLQTNSGDTPAGVAQTIRNTSSYGNRVLDYRHGSSPKANETYNNIGTFSGDTADATTISADPQFVGGVNAKRPAEVAPGPNSPNCAAGTPIDRGENDFMGINFAGLPAIGAIECGVPTVQMTDQNRLRLQ